jgi:hypothetical protein
MAHESSLRLTRGAFGASSGPSFGMLGLMDGSMRASSPDGASICFITAFDREHGE